MHFEVLGPLRVLHRGAVVAVGGPQQRRLLAALLLHVGDVLPADRLAAMLWGRDPPATARAALWTYVSRLRKAFALAGVADVDAVLVTRPPGYVLHAAPDEVDALRFERLVSAARDVGSHRPGTALALLDEALGLWRGDAYAEFADEEFARAEALRLEELRLAACEARFEVGLAVGRHAELAGELEAFTADHPLRERPRAGLMLALYRCGRQAEAVAAYRRYRDLLADELGLEPSVALQELERDLLRQHPRLTWTPPPDAGPVADVVPAAGGPSGGHVPVELSTFIGREAEVHSLLAALDAARLVTLTGVGGVGKTRLAAEVAARAALGYREGVRWCELAPLADPAVVPHALATVLGTRQHRASGVEESLLAHLAPMQVLLVVDNCEHVLDVVAPLVSRILGSCPHVKVLATSRSRLGITGERVWSVIPLEVPAPDLGVDAARTSAMVLFVDRARTIRPGFDLGPDLATVAEMCRRLDGLPLAIELAAARLASMNPADLAARLDDRFRLLMDPRRRTVERHRTLRAVLDWSYELLPEPQRRLFDRLSVFAGGFTLAAAESVGAGGGIAAQDVVDLLAGLVENSLVTPGSPSGEVRYTLLETLRQYGRDRLTERGEAPAVGSAHTVYYVDLVERASAGLRGADEDVWMSVLEREFDNLRAAHAHAVERRDADAALRLSAGLALFVLERFRDEVISWGEAALELPQARNHPLFPRVCGSVGEGHTYRGNLAAGLEVAERGLVRTAGKHDHGRVYPLKVMAVVALYEGRVEDCFDTCEEYRRVARCHGDLLYEATALMFQAMARTYGGRPEEGLRIAREQYRIAAAMGSATMQAWALYNEGEALALLDPVLARRPYEQGGALADSVGSEFCSTIVHVALAALLGRHGDPGKALGRFQDIIRRWQRMGVWQHQWTTLRNLVPLLVRAGEHVAAAVLLGAIEAAEATSPTFGDDARQLADAKRQLRDTLGQPTFENALLRGMAMSGPDAVAFAIAEIERRTAAGAH